MQEVICANIGNTCQEMKLTSKRYRQDVIVLYFSVYDFENAQVMVYI